jgi:NAD(P)-dependent dehydrogenase (short-subunit alcohol dehydrogenase family)
MKNYIVTGATKGIGLSVSRILLEEGASVLGIGRSDPSNDAIQQLQIFPCFTYFQIDLASPNAGSLIFDKSREYFDVIDGLVLNAGIIEPIDTIAKVNVQEWKKLMDVNVYSHIELLQKSIPTLRKGKGSVIFVSSGASTEGYGGWGPYCVSKAAFNIICGCLAKEEPEIHSVAIRPGVVDTEMQATIRSKGSKAMPSLFYDRFVTLNEKKELLHPDLPAKAIARLSLHPLSELNGKYVQWDSIDVTILK